MVIATKDILKQKVAKKSVFHVKYRKQWAAAFTAQLLTLVHGIAIGWLSPILIKLQSEHSPLNFEVTNTAASWIGTCWGIGALTGNLILIIIQDLIGRKNCIYFVAIPNLSSWFLIHFAKSVEYLYLARILGGITGGMIFGLFPMFCTEIADTSIRGALSTLLMMFWGIGILLGYIISSYVDYFTIPYIAYALPILYLLAMSRFPETPQHLLRKGKVLEAKESFMFYKNIKNDNDPDAITDLLLFEDLKSAMCKGTPGAKAVWSDYFTRKALLGWFNVFILAACNQLSGSFSLTQYMSYIFLLSGSSMDPNLCTILMGIVQIVGTLLGIMYVDRIGRRIMMLLSMSGVGISYLAFAFYLQFVTKEMKTELFWAPVAFMVAILFLASIGIIALTSILVFEAFPAKIRTKAASVCMFFFSGILSVQLKIYPMILFNLGIEIAMYYPAFICIFSFIILYFTLPETKNKSIDFD